MFELASVERNDALVRSFGDNCVVSCCCVVAWVAYVGLADGHKLSFVEAVHHPVMFVPVEETDAHHMAMESFKMAWSRETGQFPSRGNWDPSCHVQVNHD